MQGNFECVGDSCGEIECGEEEYLCPNTDKCLPMRFRCDRYEDCPGGEDELDCGE